MSSAARRYVALVCDNDVSTMRPTAGRTRGCRMVDRYARHSRMAGGARTTDGLNFVCPAAAAHASDFLHLSVRGSLLHGRAVGDRDVPALHVGYWLRSTVSIRSARSRPGRDVGDRVFVPSIRGPGAAVEHAIEPVRSLEVALLGRAPCLLYFTSVVWPSIGRCRHLPHQPFHDA